MHLPYEDRLVHRLKRAEQATHALKVKRLREIDLTVPQYAALLILDKVPGATSAELARRAFVTPQTMASIVANLEGKGLVERRAHPYHRKLLETQVTAAGKRLLAEAERRVDEVEAQMSAGLSERDRQTLARLLGRVVDNVGAAEAGQAA